MKDVIIFDIQQYRIFTLLSACFFSGIPTGAGSDEKCSASSRKPDFLHLWGAKVPCAAHGFCSGELFFRTAYRTGSATEGNR